MVMRIAKNCQNFRYPQNRHFDFFFSKFFLEIFFYVCNREKKFQKKIQNGDFEGNWNFDSFWLFASPFYKNICIFLTKMILNIHTNLYSSPELCSNSHFCSIVKSMQNSLKLWKFLSAVAAPFYNISKNLFTKKLLVLHIF